MADVRIRCVSKQPRQDPHHGITHLGGENWNWARQQVIDSIEAGTNTFYTSVGGVRAMSAWWTAPTANTSARTRTGNGTTICSRYLSALRRSKGRAGTGEYAIPPGRSAE